MRNTLKATLNFVPMEIVQLSIMDSRFSFLPGKPSEPSPYYLTPEEILFHSQIDIVKDEKDSKIIQVLVGIKNAQKEEGACQFRVHSLGVYVLRGLTSLDDTILKTVYNWAVAVQTGAIRQHVIQETSRGPHHRPLYIPVALVSIEENVEEDKKEESAPEG